MYKATTVGGLRCGRAGERTISMIIVGQSAIGIAGAGGAIDRKIDIASEAGIRSLTRLNTVMINSEFIIVALIKRDLYDVSGVSPGQQCG